MRIGTLITAPRVSTVVHVEQSGEDYGFPNNLVVVDHDDGTFAHYMHLTRDGALVTEGARVLRGDSIGWSGATGLAGYPQAGRRSRCVARRRPHSPRNTSCGSTDDALRAGPSPAKRASRTRLAAAIR